MAKSKASQTEKESIARQYRNGSTSTALAEKYGVTPATILVWVKKCGTPTRSTGRPVGHSNAQASTFLGRLIFERRVAMGLSGDRTAAAAGFSRCVISNVEWGGGGLTLHNAARLARVLDLPLQDLADAAEMDVAEKEAR